MNIIIDYGLGNLDSVVTSFEKVGIKTKISSDKNEISNAKTLILPGVGAFEKAIECLNERGFSQIIKEHTKKNKYLIGICLGMQLLYEKSYEHGEFEGLGLIEGNVEKIQTTLKIPHMGWNNLKFNKKDEILKYIKEDDYVYFVHSYCIKSSKEEVVAYSEYEDYISAIVRKDNVYGMQFHPEKSEKVGLNLLRAYGEMIR